MKSFASALLLLCAAQAGAENYVVDPNHTYPSFEADHKGLSLWRGKFRKTSGTIQLDRTAHAGEVDIVVDAASIDFGLDKMNEHARSEKMFDVEKFPTANYRGKFSKFDGDSPTEVQGQLTLHGVTKPLTLQIHSFACKENSAKKKVCGADASATFNRADFGVDFGGDMGFKQEVKLAIQVEAVRADQ